MCGRFSLISSEELIRKMFRLNRTPLKKPRYNIAPSQPVAAVRQTFEDTDREMLFMRWGLIPSWAKDPAINHRMINARGESVFEKPAFRQAIRRQRCLIPADGFYEWHKLPATGKSKTISQPYYIYLRNGKPFAFAGLWDVWQGEKEPVLSCAIITTAANSLIQALHERMPVIVPPEAYDLWLDPAITADEMIQPLLRAYPPEEMALHPVSLRVNSPAYDSPENIQPIESHLPLLG